MVMSVQSVYTANTFSIFITEENICDPGAQKQS